MSEPDAEIPVWINGSEKLMTGLTKRTTCDDVIYSLLMSEGMSNGDVETINYNVVERWRKMERPLQGRAKIVKVWQAWGPERHNVKFFVRKVDVPAAAMIRSRRLRKASRRPHGPDEFYDPEKVRAEKIRLQNIEDLVHLVREQQRRMNEQMQRISETDMEIESFETKVHLQRISKRGQNYVQDSYLSLHSLSDDSSGLEDALPTSIRECELEMYLKICDNILQLEERVNLQKQRMGDLHFQLKEESASDLEEPSAVGVKSCADGPADEHKMLQDKIRISTSLTEYNHKELRKLSQDMTECDNALRRKHEYMEYLMKELEAAEKAERGQGQFGHVGQYGALYAAVGGRSSVCSDSSEVSSSQNCSLERVHVPIVSRICQGDKAGARDSRCSSDSNSSSPPTVRTVRFSDSSSTSEDRGYFSPVLEKCAEYPYTHFNPRPLKSILKHTAHSLSCNDLQAISKDSYDDNDSNSDTGLSSLHSDEALPILETLV